jgi:hypothetical protein
MNQDLTISNPHSSSATAAAGTSECLSVNWGVVSAQTYPGSCTAACCRQITLPPLWVTRKQWLGNHSLCVQRYVRWPFVTQDLNHTPCVALSRPQVQLASALREVLDQHKPLFGPPHTLPGDGTLGKHC